MTTLVSTAITNRLAAIASTITTANGYSSNLGQRVLIAELEAIADQAPALVLIPGRETPSAAYGARITQREYEIKAFAKLQDHPSLSANALVDLVIWDLRQVFEQRDSALAALVQSEPEFVSSQPGYAEAGGGLVGAQVTYKLSYACLASAPTTAL